MKTEAQNELTLLKKTRADRAIYTALAARENVPAFKEALEKLAALAQEQAEFWAPRAGEETVRTRIAPRSMRHYRVMRALLGVTLTAKYIFGRRSERVAMYKSYCTTCTVDADYAEIERFIDEMSAVIESIKEERVTFFSNIILGFNDALIELTGVLVGLSFALRDPAVIVIGGVITGISASLSMAASAFLQARHESGRNPFKAAVFTGLSYFVISLLLVLPFIVLDHIYTALAVMFGIILLLIAVVSFYSAILLERRYIVQFREVLLLSLGVSAIAFLIGRFLHTLTG